MAIETISARRYKRERAICDKADAYWQEHATHGRSGSSMSAELAAHPDYAACNNEMRGRVQQYELLRDLPPRIFAYMGGKLENGAYPVQVWTGLPLGYATRGATWRPWGRGGTVLAQFYATIRGREYTGRGQGCGMCILLRETAASKRKRGVPA